MSKTALDVLKNEQQQVDMDGVMAGVSRQALDEVIKDYELLQQRNKALGAAFTAAKGYIDASPCDPDINNEQIEAYQKYQEALAQLDKEGNQ